MTETPDHTDEIQWMQSPTITALMPAMLDAVAEFAPVTKDAVNPHFGSRFATLASMTRAVDPALWKHRLLLTQATTIDSQGRNVLFSRVIHESGEWIGARWKLTPVKNDPQSEGSALSYARRYTALALLGIAAEDDDANAASARERYIPPTPPPREVTEPSGRNWSEEAHLITKLRVKPEDKRVRLLELMDECRGFGELSAGLHAELTALGLALRAEIDAAA